MTTQSSPTLLAAVLREVAVPILEQAGKALTFLDGRPSSATAVAGALENVGLLLQQRAAQLEAPATPQARAAALVQQDRRPDHEIAAERAFAGVCMGCGKPFGNIEDRYTDGVEGPFHAHCVPSTQKIVAPTEPVKPVAEPAPQWDADKFLSNFPQKEQHQTIYDRMVDIAQAARADGFAAGRKVAVPEEMPASWPRLWNEMFTTTPGNAWAALRTHLAGPQREETEG